MKFDIVTIFPQVFEGFFSVSIMKRALDRRLFNINLVNLRDFTHDRHKTVDDRPYGGGAGMIMKPEPLFEAVESLRKEDSHIVLLSPQGKQFDQVRAKELSTKSHIILLCGHYEGVDDRVRTGLVNEELSIGDYILTNGNLAAMVLVDAVVRLIPGVLGCSSSILDESFETNLLEYPQYTRPEVYRNMRVPEVLLTGNHAVIKKWRTDQSIKRTLAMRPELLDRKSKGPSK